MTSFGAAALRHAGLAARALGWRPAEFWSATPGELAACLGPPGEAEKPMDRGELKRMMETDDGDGPWMTRSTR